MDDILWIFRLQTKTCEWERKKKDHNDVIFRPTAQREFIRTTFIYFIFSEKSLEKKKNFKWVSCKTRTFPHRPFQKSRSSQRSIPTCLFVSYSFQVVCCQVMTWIGISSSFLFFFLSSVMPSRSGEHFDLDPIKHCRRKRERERDSVYRKANADITLYNVVDVPMVYKRE